MAEKMCNRCGGTGRMECVQCFGSGKGGQDGKQPCAWCKGSKKQTCIYCGGSGRVRR